MNLAQEQTGARDSHLRQPYIAVMEVLQRVEGVRHFTNALLQLPVAEVVKLSS
jgi:hypothetical protein